MQNKNIINTVRRWVETIVVDLNLCPFAKRELLKNRIGFTVSQAKSEEQLLDDLEAEINRLEKDPQIETSLLIHPEILQDFFDYNDFLALADELLESQNWQGIYQVASFHPDYQFADSPENSVENYTNRSPYPLLHIIREQSLTLAIDNYPDVEQIPINNTALMQKLGLKKMTALMQACIVD